MTELLYLNDSYLKEFQAQIVSVKGKIIELDRTAFYVHGGGQPSDSGHMEFLGSDNGKARVLSVRKIDGRIIHELDTEAPENAVEAKCGIDWGRRYRLMKMHSSAHLLAAVIFKETGKLISGNQLGEDYSRMDFNVEKYDTEFLKGIEEKANAKIAEGLDITVSFLPRDKALELPELFRLKDVLPKNLQEFRIVSIGGFDRQADGGTHVKNTSEIGKIKITKTENKGADNRRIYWELTG
ncbi:MAG: alanyl-tRNA editing protein [Candidatus Diapherotrites archaeon]